MIGAGTSSVVYLNGRQQVEKRFTTLDDLRNEQTIYEILGSHRRLIPIRSFGPDHIVMDWMENGDLARFIESNPEIVRRRRSVDRTDCRMFQSTSRTQDIPLRQ